MLVAVMQKTHHQRYEFITFVLVRSTFKAFELTAVINNMERHKTFEFKLLYNLDSTIESFDFVGKYLE